MATFAESISSEDHRAVDVKPALCVMRSAGHVGFTNAVNALPEIAPSVFKLQPGKGVSASGTIVDAQTGRPVSKARIHINPT